LDSLLDFAEEPRGSRLVLVDFQNTEQRILRFVNLSPIKKESDLLHLLTDQVLL